MSDDSRCPDCHTTLVETGGGEFGRELLCTKCKQNWFEHYEVTKVTDDLQYEGMYR